MRIARALIFTLLLPGASCVPGKGTATIYGELGAGSDRAGGVDQKIGTTDQTGPASDTPPGPTPDGPVAPKPDTQPATPQGPFGTTVGKTAQNVTGIPNCDSSLIFDLHSYYKKTKGVVLPIMSPS
jgi:hypothetical protein